MATEQGGDIRPDNSDELATYYDVYVVPQDNGKFEAHIRDNRNRVEFYRGGYESEAEASIAAMQWVQTYMVDGGEL